MLVVGVSFIFISTLVPIAAALWFVQSHNIEINAKIFCILTQALGRPTCDSLTWLTMKLLEFWTLNSESPISSLWIGCGVCGFIIQLRNLQGIYKLPFLLYSRKTCFEGTLRDRGWVPGWWKLVSAWYNLYWMGRGWCGQQTQPGDNKLILISKFLDNLSLCSRKPSIFDPRLMACQSLEILCRTRNTQ